MQGWQFAAELSQLRIVGRVDLPAMSATFAAMNRAVDSTADGETAAFQAPGGGIAPSHAAWSALRDDFQNVLGTTAGNLLDAGSTIEHIVDAYALTDEGAPTSLEKAWEGTQIPGLQEAEERYRHAPPPSVVLKDEA
ncbi:hypothetical protein Aab01nite_31520 [Paractinoplanes abujensis]|uniref:Excreted virulence factor EspC (Type VII ESX diderm) n=1 Tax=Paractinoplanes abujensis TaxID=882441 RepID=A0A7W7D280_9ACTN|nr:hypothetical protein [Actinoplanes abujensis]MBB4697955.1 hypothetical protein [Actinoplanes abujensis]GID19562.1 hypothetical protein Aab01nite_31520 [Actinoplanes abujensis]